MKVWAGLGRHHLVMLWCPADHRPSAADFKSEAGDLAGYEPTEIRGPFPFFRVAQLGGFPSVEFEHPSGPTDERLREIARERVLDSDIMEVRYDDVSHDEQCSVNRDKHGAWVQLWIRVPDRFIPNEDDNE